MLERVQYPYDYEVSLYINDNLLYRKSRVKGYQTKKQFKEELLKDLESIIFDKSFLNIVNGYVKLINNYAVKQAESDRLTEYDSYVKISLTLERAYNVRTLYTTTIKDYDWLIYELFGRHGIEALHILENTGYDFEDEQFVKLFRNNIEASKLEIKGEELPDLIF